MTSTIIDTDLRRRRMPTAAGGTAQAGVTASSDLATAMHRAVDLGIDFKQGEGIYGRRMSPEDIRSLLVTDLPAGPASLEALLTSFTSAVLPLCKNEASPRFLGFGDTGDDPAALVAGVLALLTQQNLINQSFDAPSATFVEIAVVRWLRDLLGLSVQPPDEITTVWDVGGIITHGGTTSNATAMMLAREHRVPGTMQTGIQDAGKFAILVPRGIGHYSVRSSLTWLGIGAQIIEVDTASFRYDLKDLRRKLTDHAGRIMAVVAYAGDSRTQTLEDLTAVHDVVRSADPAIWLHADACWGLVCAFSDRLRHRIGGIELFDSVTVDPHKVMAIPYGLSALLVRRPEDMRLVSTYSDLIMQEDFAFGQVTPFIGSKGWLSLKLWMMMLGRGRDGLADMANRRVARARTFAAKLDAHPRMRRVHEPDLAAVAFVYIPPAVDAPAGASSEEAVARINDTNRRIHDRILAEGIWHLHQFSLPDDDGCLRAGATLHPLRFMANNDHTTEQHMDEVVAYVDHLGRTIDQESDHG
jgi:L-2,4-diaminobutyrate decarboxylase